MNVAVQTVPDAMPATTCIRLSRLELFRVLFCLVLLVRLLALLAMDIRIVPHVMKADMGICVILIVMNSVKIIFATKSLAPARMAALMVST